MLIHQIGPASTELAHAEQTLSQLWTHTGREVHLITSNLLIITENRHLDRVRSVLNDLDATNAGRQVILVIDAPTMPIEASLICVLHQYVERIEAPARLDSLAPMASGLLRPASMNHAWWACENPPEAAVLNDLASVSDQVILDTTLLPALGQVHGLLSDLDWARTARWRELTAQLFDDPLAVTQLGDLDDASVSFAGADGRPARLFAAWLADRLGWPDLQRIHLTWVDADQARGDLTAVELSGPHTQFSLQARGALVHGDITYGGHSRSFEVPLLSMTLTQGLSELMGNPLRDSHFLRVRALLMRGTPEGMEQPVPVGVSLSRSQPLLPPQTH